jgi:putative spermidine/putrescine transport system permease protein
MGSYEIPLLLGRQSPQMMSVLVIQKLRKFSLAAIPEAYIMALVFIGILIGLLILIFNLQKSSYDID